MTAPAPPRSSFGVVDQLIREALDELRFARSTERPAGGPDLDRETRAEERLNALLDYRLAAQRR